MRVALVQHPSITLDLAHLGGLEVTELNELRQLRARGVQATLYVAHLLGQEASVRRLRDRNWRSRVLQLHYYLNLRRREPAADVYHGHYTPLLPLLWPHRSVVHFQGLAVAQPPLMRYRACAERHRSAHYVFCAHWVMEQYASTYPRPPEGHAHVVYNGVDHLAFRPGPKPSGRTRPRIVFYAGWLPEKGIYELLEAVAMLEQRRTDFEVLIGGSAFAHYRRPESPEIDRTVREQAGRLATVRLVGHIQHDQLPRLLADADIGCVPSTYEDPFPLVPLEMMAAGLPVVAFAAGGLKEAIVDGETGFLVQNRNVAALARALERLIDHEQLRLTMGAQARRRVEQHFTWDRHVDQLLDVYEQIIRRNRDQRP